MTQLIAILVVLHLCSCEAFPSPTFLLCTEFARRLYVPDIVSSLIYLRTLLIQILVHVGITKRASFDNTQVSQISGHKHMRVSIQLIYAFILIIFDCATIPFDHIALVTYNYLQT